MLNELGDKAHEVAKAKGFWDAPISTEHLCYKLALIGSEVFEAIDVLRKGGPRHVSEELADIIIRVVDYAACQAIDLDIAVELKMAKNKMRPHMHGKVC